MSLPTVFGGQPGVGQITRTVSTSTLVTKYQNGTEQRAPDRSPLVNFKVPFDAVQQADKNSLRSAVASAGGRFATNLSFVFLGTTYTNLTLEVDEFIAIEKTTGMFTTDLRLRQIIPQSLTAASSVSAFPTLAVGLSCELPFGQGDRYMTDVNDNSTGMRYDYRWYGAGLTGFPTRGLRKWPLSFPILSDADLATIEQFFIGVNGRWKTFSFTDPDDSTTYTKCRFGQDDLVVTHQRFGLSSITGLLIEETN